MDRGEQAGEERREQGEWVRAIKYNLGYSKRWTRGAMEEENESLEKLVP